MPKGTNTEYRIHYRYAIKVEFAQKLGIPTSELKWKDGYLIIKKTGEIVEGAPYLPKQRGPS